MKKIVMHIGIMILLIPLNIFAAEEGLSVDCPQNIKANDEFVCTINASSGYEVSAIEYEFSLPESVEKQEFIVDSIWEGDEENNLVLVYTVDNKKGVFNIGSLKLKAKEDIKELSIETVRLLFGDADFNPHAVVGQRSKLPTSEEEISKKPTEKEEKKKEEKQSLPAKIIIAIIVIVSALSVVLIKCRKGVKR